MIELHSTKQAAAERNIRASWLAAIGGAVLCLAIAACGDDGADDDSTGTCLTDLPANCETAINPTYDEIYDKIISGRCAGGGTGTACHGREGMQGKLGLYNADVAYDALLGKDATHRARVLPQDPSCSILMERLESKDPKFRMPLGESAPLSAGLRCAIQLWIDAGAQR